MWKETSALWRLEAVGFLFFCVCVCVCVCVCDSSQVVSAAAIIPHHVTPVAFSCDPESLWFCMCVYVCVCMCVCVCVCVCGRQPLPRSSAPSRHRERPTIYLWFAFWKKLPETKRIKMRRVRSTCVLLCILLCVLLCVSLSYSLNWRFEKRCHSFVLSVSVKWWRVFMSAELKTQ